MVIRKECLKNKFWIKQYTQRFICVLLLLQASQVSRFLRFRQLPGYRDPDYVPRCGWLERAVMYEY